jgi:hypothetical protein
MHKPPKARNSKGVTGFQNLAWPSALKDRTVAPSGDGGAGYIGNHMVHTLAMPANRWW